MQLNRNHSKKKSRDTSSTHLNFGLFYRHFKSSLLLPLIRLVENVVSASTNGSGVKWTSGTTDNVEPEAEQSNNNIQKIKTCLLLLFRENRDILFVFIN